METKFTPEQIEKTKACKMENDEKKLTEEELNGVAGGIPVGLGSNLNANSSDQKNNAGNNNDVYQSLFSNNK